MNDKMVNKLEITYKKESDLLPYINNARTHSPEQILQLKSSIEEFGMCTAIGLHNNTIVYGHARFEALKQLGYKSFPTVDLSYLSESQMKAYILADNKLAENAGWNLELISLELEELQAMDFDIEVLGFDPDEFKDVLGVDFPELNSGDKEPFQQMTFTLHDDQVEQVLEALTGSKGMGDFDSENENSNGNALARICETYNGLG